MIQKQKGRQMVGCLGLRHKKGHRANAIAKPRIYRIDE